MHKLPTIEYLDHYGLYTLDVKDRRASRIAYKFIFFLLRIMISILVLCFTKLQSFKFVSTPDECVVRAVINQYISNNSSLYFFMSQNYFPTDRRVHDLL